MNTDYFAKLVINIIREQESIIGPIAIEQAKKVPGLKIDWQNQQVNIEGDHKQILENLANQYKKIFGQVSIEVCRSVVHKYISQLSPNEIPVILQ